MHSSFQLNNQSFSSQETLLKYAENFSDEIYQFLKEWFNDKSYVVVNTSGSTGTPKPIQLKKAYMKNSALATGEFFSIKENTTALLCMSTNYIAGKMMLVRALVLGWKLDCISPVSNPLAITEKAYDFAAMVPLQLQNSLEELHRVDQLIVGGGVVSNNLIKELQGLVTKVFATYGMTETITHIAVKKLNHIEASKPFYSVLPNVDIYIDERSCLCIKASKVSDSLVITNDVVQLISESQFEWLGRFDNVINSGGIKLHPEKIEEKLSKIIDTRFFVAGVSDTVLGEKLILVVEGNSDNKECIEEKLKNFNLLTKYEKPKSIFFIATFVETETKKIQRTKTLDLLNL
ncbi:AMP-binding protein [Tenacibaculum sp. M341]|uniref:AMP-binding protein n=1 Tax=Tenacibaculum sp. M341 TaxID=2530339 RepID=UPI00268D2CF6|nr:AMP-binding protein [Tenacibaculum sp. M341]